jgi:hypothetical protein
VRDELKYRVRLELMLDTATETVTMRHEPSETALPMRRWGAFPLGDGLGGAGTHWNGVTWRFTPSEFVLRSQIGPQPLDSTGARREFITLRQEGRGGTMTSYHLMHCIPHPRMHGLNGYKEVIETVTWGLEQLGHQVTYAVNKSAIGATNIIFGAQVMPIAALKQLPNDTIIYNFEQMRGLATNNIRDEIKYYTEAEHFTIWEYSEANFPAWQALGRHDVKFVPVGYAPILSRISKVQRQDIDVLIYGLSGERRLQIFHELSVRGVSALFASGFYGPARDDLISRSKLVLNINLYKISRIFEIVRVSYLLANKKAVVADLYANTFVEDDVRAGIAFASSAQELLNACFTLLENESRRADLEESGFSCITRRDIRDIIQGVM